MTQIEKSIANFVAEGKPIASENNFRPDVRVEVVSGKVVGVDDINGNKNVQVAVEGEKYQHSGYISGNEPAAQVLIEAHEKGVPVIVRFERKRKKNADIHTSIMELTKDMNTAKENAVRTTVGVYDVNKQAWILTSEAQSSPDEDPESVETGIRSVNYNPDDFFSAPKSSSNNAAPAVTGNREHNSKVDNMVTLYFFLKEKANTTDAEVTDEQLEEFTKVLVTACDFVQTTVYKMQAPVYSAYSYTRTRFLLFNFEEHDVHLTKEHFASIDSMKDWAREFIQIGGQLWTWAMQTADEQ